MLIMFFYFLKIIFNFNTSKHELKHTNHITILNFNKKKIKIFKNTVPILNLSTEKKIDLKLIYSI